MCVKISPRTYVECNEFVRCAAKGLPDAALQSGRMYWIARGFDERVWRVLQSVRDEKKILESTSV